MEINFIRKRKKAVFILMLSVLLCGCRRDNKLQVYETIQEAAAKGDIADVKRHLSRGADINNKGYSLHYTSGLTALHLAAGIGNKELVKLLIKKGAVVNAKAEDDVTPLHWAVVKGLDKDAVGDFDGVIKLLIANGADLNALTNENRGDGGSPLQFAVQFNPDDTKIIGLIIDEGGNVNIKNAFGRSLLHSAAYWANESVVEFLIKKGADVNAEDRQGVTPLGSISGLGIFDKKVELLKKYGAK